MHHLERDQLLVPGRALQLRSPTILGHAARAELIDELVSADPLTMAHGSFTQCNTPVAALPSAGTASGAPLGTLRYERVVSHTLANEL